MDPGLIWILVGLALLGAELLLPGVYLLWTGAAAIGTGLVLMAFAPGFAVSVALFLVLLAAGIVTSLRLRPRGGPAHRVNAPEAGLAGRHATVVLAEEGGLRVRLGDSEWPARLPRGVALPAPGSVVRVEAVDGMLLVVRPESPPPA
ncbi:NfeD family protein [Roseomonas sp. AR75]|uniref:NfeD family protein n=1 Tax=Roseomonas sp. AR75 TaxID=2562311 RepID=UPI0010BFAEA2|nr:NfeD family protein [Roseomonas sp. AR75]